MSLKDLAKMINEANKEKTPEQEFLFMYNEAVVRLNEIRKPSKSYKPSSLGGCMRNCFYQVTGVEMDPNIKEDPEIVEIGDCGTDRHIRIQNTIMKMKDLGYPIEWIDVSEYLDMWPQTGTKIVERKGNEVKLYNSVLNLSFLCDGIINFKDELYILEIKTEVSFKWQGRVQPEDKHIYQATCYSLGLGIDKVMYFYENRDMCKKKPFVYKVTEDDKALRVINYIQECDGYVERGEVPPMTTNTRECNYCKYPERCKKDGVT